MIHAPAILCHWCKEFSTDHVNHRVRPRRDSQGRTLAPYTFCSQEHLDAYLAPRREVNA